MIAQHPARAASALGDISADRAHLLIGGRDILNRPEWKEVLAVGQTSPTIRTVNSHQLQNWIRDTFSASTAAPWLEAVQSLTGQKTRNAPESNTAPASGRSPLASHLGIAAGCALLTALAIAFIQQPWVGNSPAAAPETSTAPQQPLADKANGTAADGSLLGQSSSGSTGAAAINAAAQGSDRPAFGSGPTEAKSSNTAPEPTGVGVGNTTQPPLGQGRSSSGTANANASGRPPGGSSRREVLFPESAAPSATTRALHRHHWPQLQASLENGETRPNDWLIPEAQGRLSHWIQRLDWRGGALAIRLRTHEAVNPATCKAISQLYQRQFSGGSRAAASVLIESSRHAGKDSVSGFLPVCRLTANGSFSQLM